MAFFDDLGKKLSQAGQTAVQKTKEITDIARINGLISDEEKKVNNNYYQIGKILALLLLVGAIISLTACECKHEWKEATCLTPKTCNLCGVTEGKTGEHNYVDATCQSPKCCTICDATEGEPLEHEYKDGFCIYCCAKDSDYFAAATQEFINGYKNTENYGFTNNDDMLTWVEITSYDIKKGASNATYEEQGYEHCIYKFKAGTLYSYSRYEGKEGVTNKDVTQDLKYTLNYTVVNNDTANVNGKTWTIFERICDSNGNLVIKVKIGNKEKWFILKDQIDWEKSPEIDNSKGEFRNCYIYYFK